MENNSPRLDILGVCKEYTKLSQNTDADIIVIGGGIAGCMTAYFLLHSTNRNVILIEGNKISHGASGHNGGQIDVYFEKPVQEMIAEYGEDLTSDAYKSMLDAWGLLEEVLTTIKRKGIYQKYIGYNAYLTKEQIYSACEYAKVLDKIGIEINELLIKNTVPFRDEIEGKYSSHVNWITQEEGDTLLGTSHLEWAGFEGTHYGAINTAQLGYSLIEHMIIHFPQRFSIYEQTKVINIQTDIDAIRLHTQDGIEVVANDVVLCTNAYNHHLINGQTDANHTRTVRGYMAGYIMPHAKVPMTVCFQPDGSSYLDEYYYHTVRHISNDENKNNVLVSVGGPDLGISGIGNTYPKEYREDLDGYINNYYQSKVSANYYWRGDMGYTDSKLRKIGPNPETPHLRYNLGCNGVGILGSIHGGWKIAQYFLGKVDGKSVFDV